MEQVTRTAEELAKAEKLFNELIAEDRDMESLGILPHEFEQQVEQEVRASYEAWKTGEPSQAATSYQSALDKWVAQGEPTPVLDQTNSDLVS